MLARTNSASDYAPRAELVQNDFAPRPVGDAFGVQMPDGRHVRATVRYAVVGQNDLPLSGNHIGDARYVAGDKHWYVWLIQSANSAPAWIFKKGWKAEKMGFGICAFTYYRRIVENHKTKLFDKFIEVAEGEHLAPDKIAALRHARDHTQFSQSMEGIKEAIPESLKMLGHNPLLLLHDAFSKGVHELSDEQCLQRAYAVRTILILGERFARIRAENDELKQALSSLFKEESE